VVPSFWIRKNWGFIPWLFQLGESWGLALLFSGKERPFWEEGKGLGEILKVLLKGEELASLVAKN